MGDLAKIQSQEKTMKILLKGVLSNEKITKKIHRKIFQICNSHKKYFQKCEEI